MTSWGKKAGPGQGHAKFYKGAKDDLPTVQDLLWRNHVKHETAQLNREPTAFEQEHNANVSVSAAASKNPPRMRMGVTGTLIPSIAPLDTTGILTARSRAPQSSRRVPPIFGSERGGGVTMTARSSALVSARSCGTSLTSRSSRSSSSSRSSASSRSRGSSAYDELRSPSEYSGTSSLSSRAMADLRATIKEETQNMQRIASQEIAVLRDAMQAEAKRREEAERKIDQLTKLLSAEKQSDGQSAKH